MPPHPPARRQPAPASPPRAPPRLTSTSACLSYMPAGPSAPFPASLLDQPAGGGLTMTAVGLRILRQLRTAAPRRAALAASTTGFWKKLPAFGICAGSGSFRRRTATTASAMSCRAGVAMPRARFVRDVGVARQRLPAFGRRKVTSVISRRPSRCQPCCEDAVAIAEQQAAASTARRPSARSTAVSAWKRSPSSRP